MKAIETRYYGPTNTRGSRIAAFDSDGNRVSIPYPHELHPEDGHRKAADALCAKMGWTGRLMAGGTTRGYVFVFADDTPPPTIRKAMLVYQGGLANVFTVACFNLSDYGRDAVRVYQGDFRTAESIARGMGLAGATIRTAQCNMTGDIIAQRWSDDLDAAPFANQFAPQHWDRGATATVEA